MSAVKQIDFFLTTIDGVINDAARKHRDPETEAMQFNAFCSTLEKSLNEAGQHLAYDIKGISGFDIKVEGNTLGDGLKAVRDAIVQLASTESHSLEAHDLTTAISEGRVKLDGGLVKNIDRAADGVLTLTKRAEKLTALEHKKGPDEHADKIIKAMFDAYGQDIRKTTYGCAAIASAVHTYLTSLKKLAEMGKHHSKVLEERIKHYKKAAESGGSEE